jgi:predicted phage replisome organizer
VSDNQKYYYLKLKESFFDDERIRIIEGMENGHLYSNILLKMYLKSIKHDGAIQISERIPYKPEILARLLGHNVDILEKAISFFIELDLIEILDNGKIFMLDIQNYIGKSSTEGDRKRKYRKRIAAEKTTTIEYQRDICPDEHPPEIEIEIEIEKREKEGHASSFSPPSLTDVRDYVSKKGLSIDPDYFHEHFTTRDWKDKNGNQVLNWKLKALTWHRNEKNPRKSYRQQIEEQYPNNHLLPLEGKP